MNILVIGNGFDLAHGLPTKYTDFLEFVKVIKQIINPPYYNGQNQIEWGNLCPKVRKQIEENMGNVRNNLYSQESVWKDLLENNLWINYFLQNPTYQKENWIDFENEISKVIKSVDADMKGNIEGKVSYEKLSNEYLKDCFMTYDDLFERTDGAEENAAQKSFGELRDELLDDLNKLIRALEIYLCEYVQGIKIEVVSPDIQEIIKTKNSVGMYETNVINFNYTNTYGKLYLFKPNIVFPEHMDFIHGRANISNTIEANNMVLGIDEYLENDRKNKDIEFIEFKKFYQRIYKQTGCKYKEWADGITHAKQLIDDDIKRQYPLQIPYKEIPQQYRNQLYIFGHSLDITDGDILRDLILNDSVYTKIFYHNKDAMRQQIANLVKVIGQDELIRRTGGSTKTIEFKLQQDMVSIENNSP